MEIKKHYQNSSVFKLLFEKGFIASTPTQHFRDKDKNLITESYSPENISTPENWMILEWFLYRHSIDIQIKFRESESNIVDGINSVYYNIEIYKLSCGNAYKVYKFYQYSDNKDKCVDYAIKYVLNNLIK